MMQKHGAVGFTTADAGHDAPFGTPSTAPQRLVFFCEAHVLLQFEARCQHVM
jgi:hypothetical protein